MHQMITRAAEAAPDREAFRMSGSGLTYGDLERRSNQLARVLQERGVCRGDRVGIYAGKSLELAVAIYGIMKAGAAYVPMNPESPVSQSRKIIVDCDIRHLIGDRSKVSAVRCLAEETNLHCCVGIPAEQDIGLACLGWEEVEAASEQPTRVDLTEHDLAYVIYTSGSTGNPKGIMHTHRSGLSWAEVSARTYGFEPTDRISNYAPLHFDLSTLDLFATAVVEATTVIIPEQHTKFPASLAQLLEKEQVTVIYAVPFALIQLALRGAIPTRDLSALRWVLFGGEPFPVKHLRALMRLLPTAQFSNVYGPTETNGCTYFTVRSHPSDSEGPIPIGRPYDNVEALIVDEDDRPVAPGETGELLIRSPTRMRGYWEQQELTASATYHRPALGGQDDAFHRTGDLVQRQADGNLKLIGRNDRQIKTRGYRVELDEIEAALLTHETVEEAAVYAIPDGQGSQQIEALVTIKGATGDTAPPPEIADLRSHLKDHVPRYAIPARIDAIDAFPRTSTGKIDRRRLQQHALQALDRPPQSLTHLHEE